MVNIRNGIFKIPRYYFVNYQLLKHVIIFDDIGIIGKDAFDNSQELKMIIMPNDLYTIGNRQMVYNIFTNKRSKVVQILNL